MFWDDCFYIEGCFEVMCFYCCVGMVEGVLVCGVCGCDIVVFVILVVECDDLVCKWEVLCDELRWVREEIEVIIR